MIFTKAHRFRYPLVGWVSVPPLLAILLLVTARLWILAVGHCLVHPPHFSRADEIVVLCDGGPERTLHGVVLHKQGGAPQLWLTGDEPLPQMTFVNDGQFARQFAIERGVPAKAIHLLRTTSSWEDGEEIAALTQRASVHSGLVATGWYHSRRALRVVRPRLADIGIMVYYGPTPVLTYGPDDWWRQEDGLVAVVNELIEFGFYWWQYGLASWRC